MSSDDEIPDRFPEFSAKARCEEYGHLVRTIDLMGQACLRCGLFDPAWVRQPDGIWR